MKKCARCDLLNSDTAEICSGCGFTVFEEKPEHARQPKPTPAPAGPGLTAERRGDMVTLKCRTPAEACLVRESLESADIIALLPDENEIELQYSQKGFVEVQIPAAAYDSAGDLRSIVEFSAPPPPAPGIGLLGKFLAMFLAVMIVPGALIFAWLLTSYRKHGELRKAKEFKRWFLIGLAVWLLGIIVSAAISK
jgi:hypothetical protein